MGSNLLLLKRRNAPTKNWSFLGALSPDFTFTRASSAMMYNAAGTLVLVGNNTPRFDYDPSTLQLNGLLLEQQGTNVALWSQNFSGGSWASFGTASWTSTFGTAPDGTTTSNRVQLSGAQSATAVQQTLSGAGLGASQTHTVSAWVKSNTGGSQNFALKLTQATILDHFSSDLTATTTWQRFTFPQAFAAGGNGFIFGVASASGGGTVDLQVWGIQLEPGTSFATSYIPTTSSAVTRAADSLVNTSIGSWYTSAQGTAFVEIIPLTSTSISGSVGCLSDGTSNNVIGCYFGGGTIKGIIRISGAETDSATRSNIATATKWGQSYQSGNNALAVNGTLSGGSTLATSAIPTSLTQLNFTGIFGGNNYWLRSYSYYNTLLNNTQLQTISGQL